MKSKPIKKPSQISIKKPNPGKPKGDNTKLSASKRLSMKIKRKRSIIKKAEPVGEAATVGYERKYICPYCGDKYTRKKLPLHLERKHPEYISEEYTASRITFNIVNKKEKGKCVICGKESSWDENKGRYNRFCSDKCKKTYEAIAAERLKRVTGKTKQELLKDPEYQNNKMLANRKISGKYKFQDGTIRTYVGSYELKFLEFMDKFLNVKSEDLETPGPIIEYTYKGEKHKWITDAYYAPYNLAFDIKDGGDNPNNRDMPEYRAKQEAKEKAIESQGKYSYIRLTDNKFEQLIELMMELKELYLENNEYTPVIRINESEVLDEALIQSSDDKYYNVDAFINGDVNILFVTGLSGGGKTTLAKDLAKKYKAEYIEIDNFQYHIDAKENDNTVYSEYLYKTETGKELLDKYNSKTGGLVCNDEKIINPLMEFIIKYCEKHKNKKYIVEGIQIFQWKDYDKIKDYSLIVKGTSAVKSIQQRLHRGNQKLSDYNLYSFLKWYMDDNKKIEKMSSKFVFENAELILEKTTEELGPKVCTKCGSKNIGVFFRGEPVYLCKDCNEYLGTVPFPNKESAIEEDSLNESNEFWSFIAAKIKIDETANKIYIKGIDYNKLLIRIKEMYETKSVNKIFSKNYTPFTQKLWEKKKIRGNQRKVVNMEVDLFFAQELYNIFMELADYYNMNYYRKMAEYLYKNTYISNIDKKPTVNVDTSKLKKILDPEFTPKDFQMDFIKKYFEYKEIYDLDGYILSFDQGLGKTLTACCIAELINPEHVIVICMNSLKENWASEIKKYFTRYKDENRFKEEVYVSGVPHNIYSKKTKYIIVNNESINKVFDIAKGAKSTMIIVDESQNFRNFESLQTKNMLKLKNITKSEDCLMMSGTPIKANPSEIVPTLMMIDRTFTPELAKVYIKSFTSNIDTLSGVVQTRFNKTIYRKTKDQVLKLPPKTVSNFELAYKNEEPYLMRTIKGRISERFNEIMAGYKDEIAAVKDEFRETTLKYSSESPKTTKDYIKFVDNGQDYESIHDSLYDLYEGFLKNKVYPNIKDSEVMKRYKYVVSVYVYLTQKCFFLAMGEIMPKVKAEAFIELYDNNVDKITEMINNCTKKTVIFSTVVDVVNHIHKDLNDRGIGALKITGEVKNRMDIINQFKEDDTIDVIVATSQTIGTGVTLVEASQMFIFGPPYRKADFDQACDRIHRIGQTHYVNIYNVVATCTSKDITNRMTDIMEWSNKMTSSIFDNITNESACLLETCDYINTAVGMIEHNLYYVENKDLIELTNESSNSEISFDNNFVYVKDILNSLSTTEYNYLEYDRNNDNPESAYREILLVNGDPASFLEIRLLPNRDDTGIVLAGTKNKYRKHGYISILLMRAIKNLKEENKIRYLQWTCNKNNINSKKAAIKLGFNEYYSSEKYISYGINLYKFNLESYIEESVNSTIVKDYKPKGKKNLSSFKRIHITEDIINKYKKEYPLLRHVRCKDTKEYICDGYMWFDDDKLVATVGSCEYRDDLTKWIVSLEITENYKGYGLSKQILDYAVKTMNCKYLSVNKSNELAKKIYDKYGFKVYQESDKMYFMTIDKSIKESYEYIEESYIFNDKTIDYNFDKFESGDSNVVLITGLSGSGKSTLGAKIANKYKAEYIELDMFEQCYSFKNDSQLKQCGEVFYEYLTTHPRIWEKLKNREYNDDELVNESGKFIDYCLSFAKKHKDTKYVIEGIQIYETMSLDRALRYPLVILGTSAFTSFIRRLKRSGDGKIQWTKVLKDEFFKLLKFYWHSEKQLNRFKNPLNEDMIEDCINKEPVKPKKFDLQSILTYVDKKNEVVEEEAIYDSTHKIPVFIVLMHSGTLLANAIKKVTGDEYSHACISFNSKLDPMYSFGNKKVSYLNGEPGFTVQNPKSEFFSVKKCKYSVYVMYITKKEKDKMITRLKWFQDKDDYLGYDMIGLIKYKLGISTDKNLNKWFCSRFVMELIGQVNTLERDASLYSPQQIGDELDNISLVNSGEDLYKYDYRITEKNLKEIKNKYNGGE